MTNSLKLGVPTFALLLSVLLGMGMGVASGHNAMPRPTLMDSPKPVVSASLTEQDMQTIAARLNEIEPQ